MSLISEVPYCKPAIIISIYPMLAAADARRVLAQPDARLVFLDIDGVTHGTRLAGCLPDFSKMPQLVKILRTTGARVVLTSTWRLYPARLKNVEDKFAENGLPPLIGSTPSNNFGDRSGEILDWLVSATEPEGSTGFFCLQKRSSADAASLPQWIVLDDDELSGLKGAKASSHHVRTSPKGLTEEDADRAIGLLMQLPPAQTDFVYRHNTLERVAVRLVTG